MTYVIVGCGHFLCANYGTMCWVLGLCGLVWACGYCFGLYSFIQDLEPVDKWAMEYGWAVLGVVDCGVWLGVAA